MFSSFLNAQLMDIVLFLVILILFCGSLYYLWFLQQKKAKFGTRVFAGLGIGIVLGLLLQFVFGAGSNATKIAINWIRLVGNIYVGLLRMIVIPLILVSIMTAIVNLRGQKNVGKIGGTILAILLITTAISGLVGALTTSAFGLTSAGLEKNADRATLLETRAADVNKSDITAQIQSFIPSNPFLDMTGARDTSTIAVVIFASFLGFAILSVGKKREDLYNRLKGGLEALHGMVMEMTKAVLRLTPYGILGLITAFITTSAWAQMQKLIIFVIASYVAIIIMFGIHFLILALYGLNPLTYVTKAWSALTFAFVSRTSAGTLPLTVKTQTNRLGVPEAIANMGSSFALTIGQNGCAGVYPAMLAVMVAPTLGINPLDIGFLLKLMLIVAISSFGIAGVGGGATFAGLVVLSSLGFPVWIAALLMSVEPLIDMARTALNVSDAMVANLVTAKMQGDLDLAMYNSPSAELVEEGAAS